MQHQISIREINQHLSHYIELVEQGEDIIITKRGRPVARLAAFHLETELSAEQQQALSRIRCRMKKGYELGGCSIDRDKLHGR